MNSAKDEVEELAKRIAHTVSHEFHTVVVLKPKADKHVGAGVGSNLSAANTARILMHGLAETIVRLQDKNGKLLMDTELLESLHALSVVRDLLDKVDGQPPRVEEPSS